jgi:rhomboid protease GluP
MFIRRENFKQYISYYPVVSTLLAINIIVYLVTLIPGIGEDVVAWGVSFNFLIANGEWWRIVTAMFLHGGFAHILFNAFSLFVFAPDLERLIGKGRFILIYFASGLAGNILTYIIQDYSYASLGASGAIFGVFGAFAALVYYTRNNFPQLKQVVLPLVIISVVMTFLSSGINVTAHLGGLVTGFVIGLYFFNPQNRRRLRAI